MTIDEIISGLEDQAQDKDRLAGGDPESIFTEDATVLIEAAKLLKAHRDADLTGEIAAAKRDIAAILWLDGHCEYCAHGKKVSYSGASRWTCKLGSAAECRPEWRGRCAE